MTMVEPWIYTVDLDGKDEEFNGGEDHEIDPRVADVTHDLDAPVAPLANKKRTTKQDRVSRAAVTCYQCNNCIWHFHAVYLHDESLDGKCFLHCLYIFSLTCCMIALD